MAVFSPRMLAFAARTFLLGLIITSLPACARDRPENSLAGRWSAPSLSQPATPILINLKADGTATEQIGAYTGAGHWEMQGTSAKIHWDSGWVGRLRKSADDMYRLETWKKESDVRQPPDDSQFAKRL